MCGICGIADFTRHQSMPEELVHRMNETLRHRGPDDEGIYTGPGVGLGHRRLSIIDLAGGHQPMTNEDRSVWVLLNGEIYNYTELRTELSARGHHFVTRSDTEAIVHLYEDTGEGCFARLRGMFAIAIWDAKERRLLLARDRVGKKPLFYSTDGNRILFGSELKALLAADNVPRTIDPQALCDYFSFGYIPAPKSIYRAVRKVRPGHYLVASAQGVREVEYWDLSFGQVEERNEEEWCQMLRHQLCEATRVRLMSDVPLGAFLSGGVDSSSVVAAMSHIMKRPVTTCSIGFEEQEFNEADYARQISQKFHTEHHEQTIRPNAIDIVGKLAWHYDEPFADSSAVPTFYVSQVARQHVTVALGGDGGDESFAGYRRYIFDYWENQLRRRVSPRWRRHFFGPLSRWYPPLAWAPRVFRAKATLQSLSCSPLEGYFNSVSGLRPNEKPRLFNGDFCRALEDYNSLEVLRDHYNRADTDDLLSRIQYVDIKTYLPDDILVKVDRASMAVSLEVRAPLLDHHFLEMVAKIPRSLKLRGRTGKYIFKKALEGVLPHEILHRKKQGFAVPVAHWFRHELREMAYDTIFSAPDEVLDSRFMRIMWEQHQKGTHDRSAVLWGILMYRKWQELFRNGRVNA
jgi:asparagine synthase (glutamine-hydrolysing)